MTLSSPLYDVAALDFDGVVVDSDPTHRRLIIETIHACFGVVVTEEEYAARYTVYGDIDAITHILEDAGVSFSANDVGAAAEKKQILYQESLRHVPVVPGAVKLIRGLREAGVRIAIASGSLHGEVEQLLRIKGLSDCVWHIVGADDTEHHKPHPEPYLRACELMECEPARAFTIEDSLGGAKAAQRAGLGLVIGLLTTTTPDVLLGSNKIDCVVGDLTRVLRLVLR